jgi:polyphosphate kinase
VFWFDNGGSPSAWIGSADLMHRNLDRRVECLVELPGQAQVDEVGRLLDLAFDDTTASWWLEGSGEWVRHHVDADGAPLRDLQDTLVTQKRRRRTLRPQPNPSTNPG